MTSPWLTKEVRAFGKVYQQRRSLVVGGSLAVFLFSDFLSLFLIFFSVYLRLTKQRDRCYEEEKGKPHPRPQNEIFAKKNKKTNKIIFFVKVESTKCSTLTL